MQFGSAQVFNTRPGRNSTSRAQLSARTSKGNVLHTDVAFALDRDPSIDSVQFLVKTKGAF
jgi:hypothetical protein